ncbi:MAG: glycosyltransferase, partial [Candidatus Omnitrophica bacterium]|nr:glycosyltransferase [Candidatus Omnitrophota bacterium]
KQEMRGIYFVSIVIPSYNNSKFIVEAIKSIFNQSYPRDKFEIIIVDDGSTDDTRERVDGMRKSGSVSLRYFYQNNKGPAAARNLGIRNSRGEIIAFVDSDCVVSKTWLQEISRGYDNQRVAGIGGTIRGIDDNSIINRYCVYVKIKERPKMDKTGIVYLITANASFRKCCLDDVGGFDERYTFAGGEDPDLCYRLRKMDYYFKYNPRAVIFNRHKKSLKGLANTYFHYGKGESLLVLKNKSEWDITRTFSIKWFFNFFKIPVIIVLMAIVNFIRFTLRLVKIPFKSLIYYSQGLDVKDSLSFSILDYVKDSSFKLGFSIGYILGMFKGFKNTPQ